MFSLGARSCVRTNRVCLCKLVVQKHWFSLGCRNVSRKSIGCPKVLQAFRAKAIVFMCCASFSCKNMWFPQVSASLSCRDNNFPPVTFLAFRAKSEVIRWLFKLLAQTHAFSLCFSIFSRWDPNGDRQPSYNKPRA